jgi:hypothetical protein
MELSQEVGRMLGSMIRNPESFVFVDKRFHETEQNYDADGSEPPSVLTTDL